MQLFYDVIRISASLQILFSTWLLKWSYKVILCSFQLFANGHIRNVVSTSSNVVNTNVEIRNVDSMLLNVVNFSIVIHNVVSTWHWSTSRRHINFPVGRGPKLRGDILNVFWTSYVRSIYVLCLRGYCLCSDKGKIWACCCCKTWVTWLCWACICWFLWADCAVFPELPFYCFLLASLLI